MRLRKRIISIIMTIVLVIGTVFGGGVIPANAAITSVKKGSTFTSGKYRYKVVSISEKSGTVSLIGAKSKKLAVVEMPDTVKKNGCTFKVTEIGNNAFKGYKKLTSVTTNTELKKIGKNAFNGCKKLSEIDIESTKLVKVGKNALKGIAAEATVEVPKGKESLYGKLFKAEVKNGDVNEQPETTEQSQESEQIKDMEQAMTTEQATTTEQPETTEHTHSFTNYVYNGDATCIEDGTETAVCDGCDVTDTRTKVGSALGHSFGEWQIKVDATCEEAGSKEHICSVCGAVETEVIEALGHDMQGVETVEPTCTEDGRITDGGKCSRCGYVGEEMVLSALGHSFTDYEYNEDATCTEDGTETAKCDRCEETDTRTKVGSALGHSFTDYEYNEDATCTEDGTETAKCDRCEETDTRTASGTMKAHSFADWVTKTEPTCTLPGSKERVCSVCGAVDTKTIDALGHDMQPVADIEPTCTKAGRKYLEGKCSRCGYAGQTESIPALGHSFTSYVYNGDATCAKDGTETAKCDRCGKTDTRTKAGTKKEHTFGEWVVKQEPVSCKAPGYQEKVCTVCGYAVGRDIKPDDHQLQQTEYVEPTCLGYGKQYSECTVCGQVFFHVTDKPLGHDWKSTTIEPTCTTQGYTVMECTRCHEKKDAVAVEEALGHNYPDEWVIDKEATCKEPGQKSRQCSRCDSKETEVIPATGQHHYVENKPCSCAAPGYWSEICEVCGKKAGEYKAAPPHTLKQTILQPASCTDYGKQYSECTKCGQVFFHVTDKPLGHNWEEITVPATCTTAGYTAIECSNCHEKKNVVVTDKKLGHDFSGEWVIDEEPTCVTVGYESVKCLRCDQKKTATIPSNGAHKYKVTETTEPTCTAMGTETQVCEYCGDTKKIPTTPVTSHDFDIEKVVVAPTCEKSGVADVECKTCGLKKSHYTIPATGHEWDGDLHVYEAESLGLASPSIIEGPGLEETGKVVDDDQVTDNCSFKFVYQDCDKDGCKAKKLINIQKGNGHKWNINEDQTTATCEHDGWWQHYYYCEETGKGKYGSVENTCPVNRWIKDRLVWAVVVTVDPKQVKLGDGWITYGGNDEHAAIVKTTIMSTGEDGKVKSYDVNEQNKITITAPEPAEGYQFVGWKDLQTNSENNIIKEDTEDITLSNNGKTITFSWKTMGTMYEAVYKKVAK